MGKKLLVAAGAALSGALVIGLLVGTALAAGPGPKGNGNGATIGGRDTPIAVAADLTGLTEEEVLAELEGGKTIPVLLEEEGVDLTTFHQAVADARQAAVDEAVDEGKLTQEQAGVMKQRMAQNQAEGAGPHGYSYGDGDGECDGTCDGDMNRLGPASGEGFSWGGRGDGTGPGLEHRYGGSTR